MGRAANFIHEYARMLAQKAEASPEKPVFHPGIVISREFGSGGCEVGKLLAERLHFKLCDREILEDLAKRSHLSPGLLARLDERPASSLSLLGESIVSGVYLTREEFDRCLRQTVESLLKLGSVVILGRGAVFMAKPRTALRLRIVAPLELRIEALMRRTRMSEKDALLTIRQIETERRLFQKRVYGMDEAQPACFDLAINLQSMTLEDAAELALDAYRRICGDAVVPQFCGCSEYRIR